MDKHKISKEYKESLQYVSSTIEPTLAPADKIISSADRRASTNYLFKIDDADSTNDGDQIPIQAKGKPLKKMTEEELEKWQQSVKGPDKNKKKRDKRFKEADFQVAIT